MMLDSANAETLAFAERFRARFGRDLLWEAVAGYDAARLAVAAVRAASLQYLVSLNVPTRARPRELAQVVELFLGLAPV